MIRKMMGVCMLIQTIATVSLSADAQQKLPKTSHAEHPAGTTLPVNSAAVASTMLWRVSGNGLTKPSFLFGTLHLICQDDYVWPAKVKESFGRVEQVCFELNISDPSAVSDVYSKFLDRLMNSISDGSTEEQVKLIRSYITDTPGAANVVNDQLNPMLLQKRSRARDFTCVSVVSCEDSIATMARYSNKRITGIEEATEQAAMLETLPLDSMFRMILDQNRVNETAAEENAQLLSAYKKQDLQSFYSVVMHSKELSLNRAVFIEERNKKWSESMGEKMKKSPTFFAFGAAHLYGASGLIELLRKQGYAVEPM